MSDSGDRTACKPNEDCEAAKKWHPDLSLSSPQARDWFEKNKETRHQPLELNKDGTYTVKHNDALDTIAERELRAEGKAINSKSIKAEVQKLVDLNKEKYPCLEANPELIQDGWRLKMGRGHHRQPDRDHEPEHHKPRPPRDQSRPASPSEFYGDAQQQNQRYQPQPQYRPEQQYQPYQQYQPTPQYQQRYQQGPDIGQVIGGLTSALPFIASIVGGNRHHHNYGGYGPGYGGYYNQGYYNQPYYQQPYYPQPNYYGYNGGYPQYQNYGYYGNAQRNYGYRPFF